MSKKSDTYELKSKDENYSSITTFISGFVFGSIFGGVLSMLYTPYSGKKLRKKINRKKEDFVDNVSEQFLASKEIANDLLKDSKKKASDLLEGAKKIIHVN